MMDAKTTTAVIACTTENATEMAAAVKRWPELHALVKDLQQQSLFPGLRGLRIRLTGSDHFVGKGLDAIDFNNASKHD